jgi:phosphate transport system protein
MSHYEERLQADLDRIRADVISLADSVRGAFRGAMTALLTSDDELAHVTVLGDHPVNRASRDLDRRCHAFIARHLPSAYHLRLISSVIRVNVALERIGDYSVTISREALVLSDPPSPKTGQRLSELTSQVESLLEDSVTAFVDGNAEAARALMSIPAQLETSMDAVYETLIEGGKKRTRRETVVDFIVFGLVKRVGDQAKNICDQTVFAMTGELKPTKVFSILFIDDTNGYRSMIAEAAARKRYPQNAEFLSAGRDVGDEAQPELMKFLEGLGVDADEIIRRSIDSVEPELQSFDVVISLDKKVRKYFDEIPFHTSTLRWELDDLPSRLGQDDAQETLTLAYRQLGEKIDELMQLLVGDDAS